ncbi:glutathione S-transferase family protein [Hydrogenophaga sp. IBVHS2]|uniref:glutathione S-transferase family protein n=1 Tax=Hydrogenophaga sp. IBVHS2 TaxID=1985170 RepID=UPI00211A080E|nr:glutathione S-transferase C-terminal domain-containing protein [Hydrogenophaga sp. IBVHS2]
MYQLLSAKPSPYARKVRIQLAEKGIPFDLITEVPWNSDTQTPRWNPLEKLPVLICPDGSSVFESRLINEWIEARHPEPALMPADMDARFAVKRIEVICDGACDALILQLFENARPEDHRSQPWIDRQRRKVDGALRELARVVGDRGFCVGDRFTLADVATGTLLGYLKVRWPHLDWPQQYPNLAAFSERIEQRPSFAGSRPTTQVISDRVV